MGSAMNREKSVILVVDDDRSTRIMLQSILQQDGYRVIEAANGEQCLAAYVEHRPHMVLLDAKMPVMDGFTCCTKLKGLPMGDRTPVLMITGLNDRASVDQAFQAGATDYVTKPIHFPVLLRRLRYLLDATMAEVKLRESEERYAATAQGANDGLWDWDLKTNQIYFSPRWKAMLGFDGHEINNNPDEWFKLIHIDDRDHVRTNLSAHLSGRTSHFECEFRILHQNGHFQWFRCRGLAFYDETHQAVRIAGSQTDITDYHRALEQLAYDALHDAMTGLPNRVLLLERIRHALNKSERDQSKLCAVAFLDLDRFKLINDSLGHIIGDQLLTEVAQRLKSCLRPIDTVARLGGDEFVLLLDEILDIEYAIQIIQRVQRALKNSFHLDGNEVFTNASIGIAISGSRYERPEELLRDADTAMYHAKNSGKDCYAVFNQKMHSLALTSLKLESDLRRAIDRQEFRLVYQPIVSMVNQDILGFEALIRWHHPERGTVSPADFIPLAEETGLIVPIGWWVLQEACWQMHRWQEKFSDLPPLSISVNISSNQFYNPDFVPKLAEIFYTSQLELGTLKLEITEDVIMEDVTSITKSMADIIELGIRLCIDDFGTGYSSLNYLNSFPVDTLKLDRSFVKKIHNYKGLEIVKTIVSLAHNLRMNVVAEGVETEVQFSYLKSIGCECAQGYFFFKPLYREDAEALLAKMSAENGGRDLQEKQRLAVETAATKMKSV